MCNYRKDLKNYDHKGIPGSLQNLILFENLTNLFKNLSKNATQQYAGEDCTQGNESLNAIMARKASKSTYRPSESADFRFAYAVSKKNKGTSYLFQTIQFLGMQLGEKLNSSTW